MPEPQCPKCGSVMVIKTARSGFNAGGQFYGCTRFPRCRGTVAIGLTGNQQPNNGNQQTTNLLGDQSFPRILVARSKLKDYQVRFFESVSITPGLLNIINEEEVTEEYRQAFSQWRLDYPDSDNFPSWSEEERQILSVAEKILTRGSITLCSSFIENGLSKKFIKSKKIPEEFNLEEYILLKEEKKTEINHWLDSHDENIFYQEFLVGNFGHSFCKWVLPQVDISSLLPLGGENTLAGRIDFLICAPESTPIVVEIDGAQHTEHRETDLQRDSLLGKYGYDVVRIPAYELESLDGESFNSLKDKLENIAERFEENADPSAELMKYVRSIVYAHKIELTVLQAIQSGFLSLEDSSLWNLTSDLEQTGFFSQSEAAYILEVASYDLIELLQHIGKLYKIDACLNKPSFNKAKNQIAGAQQVHISFVGSARKSAATFFVEDIFAPFHIAASLFPANPAVLQKPEEATLEYFLKYIFRKESFWEGQLDSIARTLMGKDSIILLPTGAGKSMVFQLSSFLLPGRTVVIDPIISLMDDQIENLCDFGIDRCIAITSQIIDVQDRVRAMALFGQGEYLFAYIAPERFQTTEFRESLTSLTAHTPISLIAIDEAHCISEWGHDFRPAYLNIGRTSRLYCRSGSYTPPLIALTGTASRSVLKDIQRELKIEEFEAIVTPKTFNRPELKFHITSCKSSEKSARLLGYLGQMLPGQFGVSPSTFFQPKGDGTYSGIVFCPHVNGEFGVIDMAETIKSKLCITANFYSGKEPKHWRKEDWSQIKQKIAYQFKHNKIPVLVATKAFGMGIDKPNIRFTIHLGIPPSIESFYQEAGRAGRDRKKAYCCILVSDDNTARTKELLNPNTPVEEIARVIDKRNLSWENQDDITRSLFFLTNAFRGVENELTDAIDFISIINEMDREHKEPINYKLGSIEDVDPKNRRDENRKRIEKVLHRLHILGIILDYTIDYSSDEFSIHFSGANKDAIIRSYGEYVRGYLGSRMQVEVNKASAFLNLQYDKFVIRVLGVLINFIYEIIEKGRRRALNEMFLAATISPTDNSIRQRILRHLEATQYSDTLEQVIADTDAGVQKTIEVFESVRSPNEAAELRGQVARYLESYPDHPGLLMLRALSEISTRDSNTDVAKQNFIAAIVSAVNNYGLKESPLFDFVVWAISQFESRSVSVADSLQKEVLKKYPNRLLARSLIKNSKGGVVAYQPAWFLINRHIEKTKVIIKKEDQNAE